LPGYGNDRAPVVQVRIDGSSLASHQDSHQANGAIGQPGTEHHHDEKE